MQDKVDVPEPARLVGVRVQVRPEEGDAMAVMLTTPLNPWMAVIVIVEVPGAPALVETDVGLATIVKSCTV